MSKILKRKLNDENRIFNSDWELEYYMVPVKDKMACLLCNSTITTLKKYNANQHYETHKDNKYTKLEGESRTAALNKLKKEHLCQKQIFSNFIKQGTIATDVTYKIAFILGKRGKPFSDVEMIKECIVEAVGCLDPEKVEKYKQLPLSRRTVTERQHELAQNVTEELRSIIQNKTVYFSIALDESTDATDSAQVLFFIRAITDDFCCFEELLALGTLPGRTRGIDIYNKFKEKCFETGLNLDNLVSVCTDGAPSMKGKREGFISLLKKDNPSLENLISFHCILHQQNLCAKSATLNNTLDKVIKIVNFIRGSATRHRQFRNILTANDEIYSVDLPYHSKIRWLSSGHVLVKIISLRKEILQFYEEQQQHCELLEERFCRNVAFCVTSW